MRESARLLEQVSAEIAARAATAATLKEEAEAAEALAQLNAEQREAVARIVRSEVSTEERHVFRQNLLVNALFFLGGAGTSVLIVLFVHPIG